MKDWIDAAFFADLAELGRMGSVDDVKDVGQGLLLLDGPLMVPLAPASCWVPVLGMLAGRNCGRGCLAVPFSMTLALAQVLARVSSYHGCDASDVEPDNKEDRAG